MCRVLVVFVTDGEASHPASTALTGDELRRRRAAESEAALGALSGGRPGGITAYRLHIPDGSLARNEDVIAERLAGLLQRGDWCVATWEQDGHPDHEATGRAARAAASSAGARMLSYPVWTWHWADAARPPVDDRPPPPPERFGAGAKGDRDRLLREPDFAARPRAR